jgi:peptidyl-prolyl cis-trans isomerase SurA
MYQLSPTIWMKQICIGLATGLLAFCLCMPSFAQTQAQDPTLAEGILVNVNNDIISSYDLKQRMQLLMATSEVRVTDENFAVIQQQALRSLIDERLKLQELDHWKVKISDQEVDEEIGRMASQSGLNGTQLVSELRKIGVDPTTLRSQLKAEIGWSQLVGGRFRSNARVGKDQIGSTMEKLVEDSQKPQFEIAEIYLDPAVVGSEDAALKGANQLYDQLIKKVAPFQKVAQQFSNAPSAANGGLAGSLVSGEMDPVVESALSQMQPNEISRPIVTKDGVYIFYLISKTDGHADLALRLTDLYLPTSSGTQDQVTNRLLDANTQAVCGLDRATQRNDISVTDLGEVKLSDLQPAYDAALRPLKVGESTSVLKASNGLHRLVVCDRRIAGDETPTLDSVENSLVNRRLGMLGKRYLRDLRNAATIEYHF